MTPVPRGELAGWADLLCGLEVDVEATVEVEDASGRRAGGPLSSSPGSDPGGRRVRWEVDHPEVAVAALAEVTGAPGRGGVIGWRARRRRRVLTSALAASGWRAELAGPAGLVASVDPGRPRRWAAVTTGSEHLHLEPAGVRALMGSLRPGVLLGAAAAVLAGVLVGEIARRRSAR